MESFFQQFSLFLLQKRKQNRVIDLIMKRSIGAISSIEYKRRTIINEINYVAYAVNKTSLPVMYINPNGRSTRNFVIDDILGMEVNPTESSWYVYFMLKTELNFFLNFFS
jgi:hypothetical protein